ncbi:DnaJ domain-containing protein [Halorubrum trueperi]|uniref:DnaJ domain-containing protein n=1 Tax=Halorubrum trueperi TaxID=2004704 RepID=A0ABD5UJX8_9EURY
MIAESLSALPTWVLLGVAVGLLASALVALAFYLGDRFIGPNTAASDDGRTRTVDERRRREIRAYLTAIGERFREEHALGDVAVPFYLPEREVAVTFDAHDYFRLEGEGVYTVLCEHEMPGRGLGRRLPFDVVEPEPERGPRRGGATAGSGRDPVAAAFAELDVARDADADAVKRAYRTRVKETHPDRGGDEESFRRVREAYATARNHVGEVDGRTARTARATGVRRTDRSDPPTGFGR